MNSKLIARSLLVVPLSAMLLWAGDPWKEKRYTEWGEKDVEKILQNSPWARVVRMPRASVSGELPGSGTANPSAEANRGGGDPSRAARGVPSGRSSRGPFYVVQWRSSLTVRQALVRQEQLRGEPDPEEVERFLARPPEYYVILLFGPNMKGFQKLSEETVLEATRLESRVSKLKSAPEKVEFVRQKERIVAVQFLFRHQVGDQPLIGPEEKKVRFSCRLKDISIRADFDLRKMVREDGRDI